VDVKKEKSVLVLIKNVIVVINVSVMKNVLVDAKKERNALVKIALVNVINVINRSQLVSFL
jgi:hypothetical protein